MEICLDKYHNMIHFCFDHLNCLIFHSNLIFEMQLLKGLGFGFGLGFESVSFVDSRSVFINLKVFAKVISNSCLSVKVIKKYSEK